MKFISLDIETLGLNVDAPIIEVGAVCAESIRQTILSTFHTYVFHPTYDNCEPYAMSMHPTILKRIANREEPYTYCAIRNLTKHFRNWACEFFPNQEPITFAGKNVASFDLPMLEKQAKFNQLHYHHRTLDPGSMFWNPLDTRVPGLQQIIERERLEAEVTHTALDDAHAVVQAIFCFVKRQTHYGYLCQQEQVDKEFSRLAVAEHFEKD
jgi:DNA polymerase III alpha subunit (gram-positive type)